MFLLEILGFFFSSQFKLDISRGLVKNKVSFKVASSVTFTNVETKARNRPDINCQHFILATRLHSTVKLEQKWT